MAGVKFREEMGSLGGRAQLGRALLSHSGEFFPGGKPCRVLFNISSDSLLTTAAFLWSSEVELSLFMFLSRKPSEVLCLE